MSCSHAQQDAPPGAVRPGVAWQHFQGGFATPSRQIAATCERTISRSCARVPGSMLLAELLDARSASCQPTAARLSCVQSTRRRAAQQGHAQHSAAARLSCAQSTRRRAAQQGHAQHSTAARLSCARSTRRRAAQQGHAQHCRCHLRCMTLALQPSQVSSADLRTPQEHQKS